MKYLLDTHVLIWYFEGNAKVSRKLIDDVFFMT
jgi:PIN domain nuclease of toxin-antitoxin system